MKGKGPLNRGVKTSMEEERRDFIWKCPQRRVMVVHELNPAFNEHTSKNCVRKNILPDPFYFCPIILIYLSAIFADKFIIIIIKIYSKKWENFLLLI